MWGWSGMEKVKTDKNKHVVCTYCDNSATTKDHVPPKLLFAKPRPKLITVPACRACNISASIDDEYFRAGLVFEGVQTENSDALLVETDVIRSLKRFEARGFRNAVISNMREVECISPSGIYLGNAHELGIDPRRLNRVIERITRGLFFHHTGRRLPLDCRVSAFTSRLLSQSKIATILSLIGDLDSTVYTVGNQTFCYRFSLARDQENSSFWVFSVYGAFSFSAITIDQRTTISLEQL